MSALSKKYGLILKGKKEAEPTKLVAKPSVFGDDDDDDNLPATSTNAASASVIRVNKAAEREHQKAEAEDPTIFDYDGNYDEIQAIKNEKKEEARKADRNRESKYGASILKAHAVRQLEQYSREERAQAKERVKEGSEFADKEVFVTKAYRDQQEEVKKYREQEAEETRFNELTSVDKQKMWEIGIGRTLLNDITRDPTAIRQRKEKQKNIRARINSSPSPTREEETDKDKKEVKKSIYSDDEDDINAPEPPKKNFEGELKPGLNRVAKKAPTRAEKYQRNFTPTPPTSDDESASNNQMNRRRSSRSPSGSRETRKERGRSREKSVKKEEHEAEDVKPDVRKLSLKEKLRSTRVDKVARLAGLKAILKQRNTPEQIEEMRQRYLERKESGMVAPPF